MKIHKLTSSVTPVRVTASAACLVSVLAAGCGGSNGSSDPAETPTTTTIAAETTTTDAPPATGGPTITIDGFTYTDVTVPPGAQVTVVNEDSAEHSVTSDIAGAFSVDVEGKQMATFTAPSQPGSYPFFCEYHPDMRGVLTVS